MMRIQIIIIINLFSFNLFSQNLNDTINFVEYGKTFKYSSDALNYLLNMTPNEFEKRYYYLRIAKLYEIEKNNQKALDYYEKAKLEPEFHTGTILLERSDLDFNIALLLINLDEKEKALKLLLPRIISCEPNYIFFHFIEPEEVYNFYLSMVDSTIRLIDDLISIDIFKSEFQKELKNIQFESDTMTTIISNGDCLEKKMEVHNYEYINVFNHKIRLCEKVRIFRQDNPIKDLIVDENECRKSFERNYFVKEMTENN